MLGTDHKIGGKSVTLHEKQKPLNKNQQSI